MSKNKRCVENCGRPADPESPEGQLCTEHLEQAGWENTHSDNAHEELAATPDDKLTLKGWTFKTKPELLAWVAEERQTMEQCWICHPELDASAKDYTQRAGTSRAGIVLTVKRGQTAKEKAEKVQSLLGGFATSIRTVKGTTTLKAARKSGEGLVLVWDSNGRYDYAASHATIDGRKAKVRNVAEALRVAAATR